MGEDNGDIMEAVGVMLLRENNDVLYVGGEIR